MATAVPPSAGFPVTVSMLPPLERFVTELQDIWDSHRLTNAGPKVQAFESALRDRLGTSHCLTFGGPAPGEMREHAHGNLARFLGVG